MTGIMPSFIPESLRMLAIYLDGVLFILGGLMVLANKKVAYAGLLIALGVALPLVFIQLPKGMENLPTILKDAGLFAAALMLVRRS